MLRRIYEQLPAFFQRRIDDLWCALPMDCRLGSAYSDMRKLLSDSESWTQEQIHEWQITEIKKLLLHAYNTTAFYHRIFNAAGFDPKSFRDLSDMQRIPPTTKEMVLEHQQEIISNAFSADQRVPLTTGGTTGYQLAFYAQKRYTMAREKAFFDHLWLKAGYIAGKSEKVILRNNVLPKGQLWQYHYREKSLILDSYNLTDDNCEKIIKKLNELQIPFFHVYPFYAYVLADYMKRTGNSLSYIPQAVFASSEGFHMGQRETIESAFRCPVLLHYGHTEMCSVASWCLKATHYHLGEVYGYTELLDEEQKVITEPNKMGEITATGFNNYVFPWIRYRTADYGEYAGDVGSCSCSGRVLKTVEGRRLQEMLVTSKGNKISMTAINFHSDIFDRVKFYQFYQDTPGKVTMRIVKNDGYTTMDETAIRHALEEKLGKFLHLDFSYVESVEMSKNGKFRYVISKL